MGPEVVWEMLWKNLLRGSCHVCPMCGQGRSPSGAGGLHGHHIPPSPPHTIPLEELTSSGERQGMDQPAAPGSSLPACLFCPPGWQWDLEPLRPLAQSWRSLTSPARTSPVPWRGTHDGYPSVPSLGSPSSACPTKGARFYSLAVSQAWLLLSNTSPGWQCRCG